jgi:hypothetical protein
LAGEERRKGVGTGEEVEKRQREMERKERGKKNIHALKPNKKRLIRQRVVVPTVPSGQLIDTIAAPDQNKDPRGGQSDAKDQKHPRQFHGAPDVAREVSVIGDRKGEEHQHDDLEHQAGERDVFAGLGAVRGGGHAAADGLQDQREDVGGDVDPVEEARAEA